jgi:hypothetical protein
MSWFDAHESYFIAMVVRDRVEELRSAIDRAMARTAGSDETPRALPEARAVCDASVEMACRALAKASR